MAQTVRSTEFPPSRGADPGPASILEHASIMLFSCDADLRYTWICGPLPGLETASLLGRRDADVFSSDEATVLAALKHEVLERRSPLARRITLTIRGALRAVEFRLDTMRDTSGQVIGVSGAAIDVTAQEIEAASRSRSGANTEESEERYRALAAATREGVIIHDGERIVEVNDAFCALHGTTRERAIGRPAYTFLVSETQPEGMRDIGTAGAEPYFALACREDGSVFPIEAAGRAIVYRGRPMRVATIRDLSDREEAEVALRESEERLRGFADASSDVLWVVDVASRQLEYLSPSFERIWGEPRETALSDVAYWIGCLHPDDQERAVQALERTVGGERVEIEYRILRNDGTFRWIRDSSFPIRGPDGIVRRAAGLARDITRRKTFEAQQDLLLRELGHRVKNTLTTVQSIAQQTLRYAPSPEVFWDRFEDRLLALAKTHDLLTQENWERASLLSLLKQELSPYGKGRHSLKSREDVHLAPRAAVALGMALHELTTNAAKHGALSQASGKVTLTWSVDEPRRRLRLQWRESGGPTILAPPSRRGFGSRLLDRGIAAELGGTVRMTFAPSGLEAQIEIPLDAANLPAF
jgi:PAS domain S-box-containing protein